METLSDTKDAALHRKRYRRYLEKEQNKKRIIGHIFSLFVIIAALAYLVWCILNANLEYWYVFVPFIGAELIFLILLLLWINILWNKRFHNPKGPQINNNFSVDIFIPVFKEPLDIIEETVAAASLIDYSQKKIYILDDGEDDAMKALAEKYNCSYLRRPTHENRKAGNFNYGLKHSSGDLILALDADQVPKPDILKNLIGYFTITKIGFVQTEQNFKLPKDDPWGNSDAVFYKAMMPGKNYDNAAISCGSGVIYRRKALESVGGFSTWNLVEDLHTSMRLHDKGWISVYHM
jgi:cellulose synthase (UDP-forming)